MERNRNQEHISIRADASELLEAVIYTARATMSVKEFQFALMRVNSAGDHLFTNLLVLVLFQFALMRVSSLRTWNSYSL